MKNLNTLNKYRHVNFEKTVYGCNGNDKNGAFQIPSPTDKATMFVIASDGEGWEHVSVSRKNRCPNWIEMDHVKRLFFNDDETAMQLHVPVSEHISLHANTLHLWRPQNIDIPRPPSIMVA